MAPPLAPCGTDSAYQRHCRLGEVPCGACRTAHAEVARDQRPPRVLAPCGTDAAAQRHQKRGEPLCEPCLEARRAKARKAHRRRAADPARRAERNRRERERQRRERRRQGTPERQPAPHGTHYARGKHHQAREPLCDECIASLRPRQLAPCGTESAAVRHRRNNEVCETCRVNGLPGRTPSRPHGTMAAVRGHERRHEKLCDECLSTRRQYDRERKGRSPSLAGSRPPAR